MVAGSLALACGPAPTPEPAAPPPPPPPPPAEHVPPPPVQEPAPEVTILSDVGFSTPESVAFDKKRGVYLVSNINGVPLARDGNGFISKITPKSDGEYDVDAKFIDAEDKAVSLDSPSGLLVHQDVLYVADIDRVVMFDAGTGVSKGEVKVDGATSLNGLAVDKNNKIYVTDSGMNEKGEPTGTDAVFVLEGEQAKKLVSGRELGGPNGIAAGDDGLWVAASRTGEIFWLTADNKVENRQKVPEGGNDGLIATDDGRILVSSWAGNAVYSSTGDGKFHKEISGVEGAADIGFDCKNQKVLIPLFKKSSVVIHQLSPKPRAPTPEEAAVVEGK